MFNTRHLKNKSRMVKKKKKKNSNFHQLLLISGLSLQALINIYSAVELFLSDRHGSSMYLSLPSYFRTMMNIF